MTRRLGSRSNEDNEKYLCGRHSEDELCGTLTRERLRGRGLNQSQQIVAHACIDPNLHF